MKKFIFVGILGLFVLGSCNNSTVTHTHNEHDHATEGHNHEAEGSNHSHEGECSGEHNHEAADGHNESAEAHSDEIILPKAKAEAAGVKVSVIEPAPFQQVIKTSGQVLAAQGDESVAVATVAGVVSFRGKVTEGMSVGSGTPLVTISSKNIADGDPVQRARIAYEVSKKEYERMKELVKNKIVSDKDFAQTEQSYENTRLSYEALSKNHSAIGQKYYSSYCRICEKHSCERRRLRDHRTTAGERDAESSSFPPCRSVGKVLSIPPYNQFRQFPDSL